jgi:serpin B
VDSQFPLRKDFLDAVTGDYGATARTVDFRNKPEAERGVMNDWASEQTNGRIQDVLAPGTITELTRLVLMNAVYFKGEWTDPFDAEQTKEQPFITADGSESKCMLMWDWRGARYAEYRPDGETNGYVKGPAPEGSPYKFEWKWADNPDGWKLLELPYKGDRLSFVAILPGKPDGVADVERRLNQETVSKWLEGMSGQDVQISLPRFKMKQEFELGSQLAALGMPSAFAPGGLTGVSDDPDAQLLMISQVIHSTFVELNEKGTEAAAVTAMPAPAAAALDPEPPKPPAVFRADHPFVFLIRDTKTGAILFMGRMATP